MKSTVMDTLRYAGIVTLSQHTGAKNFTIAKNHNEGGMKLFNFLADCLLGDYKLAENDRPVRIMLLNIDNAGNNRKAGPACHFINLYSQPERVYSDSEGIVRYSFMIPSEQLIGASFNAVGLYTKDETNLDNYSAICRLSRSISNNTISLSSILMLDWELHIFNSQVETT